MKVTVNFPDLPKDAEVSVQGLGVLKNGHSYDFDAEAEQLYCVLNNQKKAPKELALGVIKKTTPVGVENEGPGDGAKEGDK
jgi:hypothetical protein